ncbi:hypothetical protein TVAG_435130 [Trichomonas vaginalis G3]|uniref:Uncharacterized protein n=1 Tax=Trichomonas vaginalis (strain ATCC PRA-98 / G3) TaxID=412133 RepID=A2FXL2_TRIV3|nr:hypothetical protein TVAGG3_0092680 [Trichomonas vaginalis G3]EAX90360.1 hypothetical protein TVAG_435130 [Trichomonas vaginalis G3]KAI5543964.1 hypothetical protein TVAGG3_0092680 [Trichomonas vaginalis G3]|eukprot:XP_001303290.1 hypothetical protein [Trichomonas vaginalis G3]
MSVFEQELLRTKLSRSQHTKDQEQIKDLEQSISTLKKNLHRTEHELEIMQSKYEYSQIALDQSKDQHVEEQRSKYVYIQDNVESILITLKRMERRFEKANYNK